MTKIKITIEAGKLRSTVLFNDGEIIHARDPHAYVGQIVYNRAMYVLEKSDEGVEQAEEIEIAPTGGALDVLAERRRQINEEFFGAEHDDSYEPGQLSAAGATYAMHAFDDVKVAGDPPQTWLWPYSWYKPRTPRQDLVRAAALIMAEIDRIDRAEVTNVG